MGQKLINHDYLIMNTKLTISSYKQQIVDMVTSRQVSIIVGEPGSGKSTKVPQYIYSQYNHKIIVTQPRRIAAVRMAERIQKEVGKTISCAYTVRFETTADESTQIHLVTDGILLKLLFDDKLFETYKIIIIDEVHERTLFIDLILFLLRRKLVNYPEHKLILTSATLDTDKIKNYFASYDPGLLEIPQATRFKLEVEYLKGSQAVGNSINIAIEKARDVHCKEPEGDILVFLPGAEDCMYAKRKLECMLEDMIKEDKPVPSLQIHCLFGSQAVQEQGLTFKSVTDASSTRKIIFATNIAETSLTIPNIVYVIDTGLVKQTAFNKQSHSVQLKTVLISKAQAIQRAGRAGRTRDGKCYRMYTKETYYQVMANDIVPEVKRSELRAFLVMLLKLGVQEYCNEDFLDAPDYNAVEIAIIQLYSANLIEMDLKDTCAIPAKNTPVEQHAREEREIHDYEVIRTVVNTSKAVPNKDNGSDITNKPHTLYFKLTKTGRLCSLFPIDPLLAKCLLLSRLLHVQQEFVYFAALSSTTENIMSQDKDVKKKFYEYYINEKDLRGDYYTYINLIKKHPQLFYYKALKNIDKIAKQLGEILHQIDVSKIEHCMKTDHAFIYYQERKHVCKFTHESAFIICVISGFSFFAAMADLNTPGAYMLIYNQMQCLLDSESIYEMLDEYPRSVISTNMRGETQQGTPVLSNVFKLKYIDLAKKYIANVKSMLEYKEDYFTDKGEPKPPALSNTELAKRNKIAEAKEKYLKRAKNS